MSTEAPLVTVIIPVYNHAEFVAESIESVLAQEDKRLTVLVADDGSTDDSARIAARYPVRLLAKPHTGLNHTLNLAVAETSTPFLAFNDADDRWRPNKLRIQLAVLTAEPALDALFCHAEIVHSHGRPALPDKPRVLPALLRQALLIRRHSLLRHGPFAETPDAHEFLVWMGRAQDQGLCYRVLEEVLIERRIHAGNRDHAHKLDNRSRLLKGLKQMLDERRALSAPQVETR